jgi:hypothetical protein
VAIPLAMLEQIRCSSMVRMKKAALVLRRKASMNNWTDPYAWSNSAEVGSASPSKM